MPIGRRRTVGKPLGKSTWSHLGSIFLFFKKYSTGEQLCDLLWLLPRPTCGPVQPDAQEGKDFISSSCCHVAISCQHKIMTIYIRRGSTWASCSTSKCCGLGCGLLVLVNWRLKDSETERLSRFRFKDLRIVSQDLDTSPQIVHSWKSCNISNLSWLLTTKSYGLLLIWSQLKA